MGDDGMLREIRDTVVATATKVDGIETTVKHHTGQIQTISEDVVKLGERSRGVRRELDDTKRKSGLFGIGGGGIGAGIALFFKMVAEKFTGG